MKLNSIVGIVSVAAASKLERKKNGDEKSLCNRMKPYKSMIEV